MVCLSLLDTKTAGCGHPEYISNTLVFEKKYNWRGIGVDLLPDNWDFIPPHLCHAEMNPFEYSDWGNRKNTTVYAADAIQLDYAKIFEENDFPDVIDYMSIDLEPPDQNRFPLSVCIASPLISINLDVLRLRQTRLEILVWVDHLE